jgi:periplasmic copper chaperone A
MKTYLGGGGLLAVLISIPGCTNPRSDLRPELRVQATIARLTPGGGGAAYLKIMNGTDTDDRLTAVDAVAVGSVGMHEVVTSGDVARMVARPEGFVIRGGETLELRPGGKHVMLSGVEHAEERCSIPLILHFEHAGTMAVEARVISAAAAE